MKKYAIFIAVAMLCLFTFGCGGINFENSNGSDPQTEDVEPNDDHQPGQAQVCSLPITGLTGSVNWPFDINDYFQIQLTAGQVVEATMSFTKATSDLDLWLYDSTQVVIKSSSTTNLTERIVYTVPTTGTYYVNVWAYSGTSDYTLVVTAH